MRSSSTNLRALLASLAVAVVAAACTTGTGPAPSRIEATPDGSFTITQDVRVGVGARGDFDAALRFIEDEQYELGIERLLEVTEAAPQLVSAHINLAIAYRHLEDWEHAQASAERALELSPRHPVAHNELGMIHRRQGHFEEARSSYKTALSIADDFHVARRNLAILCDLFLADLPCALEHYERYAKAVPEDATLEMWIADLRNRVDSSPSGRR